MVVEEFCVLMKRFLMTFALRRATTRSLSILNNINLPKLAAQPISKATVKKERNSYKGKEKSVSSNQKNLIQMTS